MFRHVNCSVMIIVIVFGIKAVFIFTVIVYIFSFSIVMRKRRPLPLIGMKGTVDFLEDVDRNFSDCVYPAVYMARVREGEAGILWSLLNLSSFPWSTPLLPFVPSVPSFLYSVSNTSLPSRPAWIRHAKRR